MFKKSLNVFLIVLIIVAVGFGSYYFFVLKKNPLTDSPIAISDFWPFGQGVETTDGTDAFSSANQPLLPEVGDEALDANGEIIRIRQLTREPVAGFTPLKVNGEAGVRYLDRATGHIFDISLESSLKVRRSNTTIPKVIEAHWNNDGSQVLMRYLAQDNETIESQIGTLGDSIESENDNDVLQELTLISLKSGIQEVAISPNKNSIAYLIRANGGRVYTTDFNGGNEILLTDLAISEWLLDWLTAGELAITTKATESVWGYSYSLSLNSGKLTKTIGNILGLTTNYQTNKKVLFNNNMSNLDLALKDISDNTITSVPMRTLPEKCLWSDDPNIVYCAAPRNITSNSYPDDWYTGTISFNDDLWRYNLETGELTLVANFRSQIDAVSLELDPDEKYLLFLNKKDGTLWSVLLD